jgi:hypothetical protein
METNMKKFNLKSLQIYSLLFFVLVGCTKTDVNGPESEAPTIPPKESFVMDFSFQSSSSMSKSTQILAKQNWGYAALNVGIWNTIITVGLAVPVGAFAATIDQDKEPVKLDDGTWVWNVDYQILGVRHTAELHGKIEISGVTWKMYISKENFYDKFLWYTGESDFLATEGKWTLNQAPDNPQPILDITWNREPEDGTADIKYTNIEPDGPENGGYIHYGKVNETPYDAFYDIFNKGKDNHTDIKWNLTSKDGRVKDPLHFGDDDWHCWNNLLEDTTCQ